MFPTHRPIVCAAVLVGALAAQDPAPRPAAQTRPEATAPRIFDQQADVKTALGEALRKAKQENQRVLVHIGSDDDPQCTRVQGLFKGRDLGRLLLYEYRQVPVSAAKADVLRAPGVEPKPAAELVALDADAKELGRRTLDAALGAAELRQWLEQHQAQPLDGERVLAEGLARAKKEDKLLFLHFGAPW
jgi:hypothetical protein